MSLLLITILGNLLRLAAAASPVSYRLDVTLDTAAHTLAGSETIAYRNQSPDTLRDIWLYVWPNAFRDRKSAWARQREALKDFRFARARQRDRGYVEVRSLVVNGRDGSFTVDDTRMKILLDPPLAPGDSLLVSLEFFVKVPRFFTAFGHRGLHYALTDWFPRVSVYDSSGWRAARSPKEQTEYGVFGSFDVSITLPAEFIVGATGDLVAPVDEVDRLDRYAIAGRSLDSLKLGIDVSREWQSGGTMKTLRFKADQIQDFAWVADRGFRLVRQTIDSISVNILWLPGDDEWRFAGEYAADALRFYRRYGTYPYPTLTVARSRGLTSASCPNLILVKTGGSPFTRTLEQSITQGIGAQWFSTALAADPDDESFLGRGLTAYTSLTCFEDKYGAANTFLKNERIPAPGQRDLYDVIHHVLATNRADDPILGPQEAWAREPLFFSYLATVDAKPVLTLDMLSNRLGRSDFDRGLQCYYRECRFGSAATTSLIRRFEEESGQDLSSFSADWLEPGAQHCDYSIRRVRRRGSQTLVTVERKGLIQTPIEVMVEEKHGLTQILTLPGDSAECTARFPLPDVRRVVLDPDRKVLEVDRWNNYYPRRYQIRPVLDVPSLEAYQIFFGPWATYGSRSGLTLTAWLQARRFYDAGPIVGRHQWTANIDYRPAMGNFGYGLTYQTPVIVSPEVKTRLGLGFTNSLWERKANVGLTTSVKPWLTAPDGHEFYGGLSFREVETVEYVDTLDFETGRLGEARLGYRHRRSEAWVRSQLDAVLQSAEPLGLTDYRYDKMSITVRPEFYLHPRLRIGTRLFGGFITGQAPRHEEYFLTGAVRLAGLSSLLFGQSGTLSPQGQVHFDGGGNVVGYYGRHLHTSRLAAGNIETRIWGLPVFPFFDAAYLDAMPAGSDNGWYLDGGLKVKVGPAAVYFPLWISRPKPGERKIAFRWVLELAI